MFEHAFCSGFGYGLIMGSVLSLGLTLLYWGIWYCA